MKIAHIVDSMEMGGAETLVMQMCRLQRQQGHEPSVCAVARLGVLGERMRAEGFLVEANIGRHFIDSARAFHRIFKRIRPDVVHLHNPTPTIYAAPAARLAGVPSIVSTRHSLVAPPRDRKVEGKYALAARFCDWIVGICNATTRNVKDAGSAPEAKIVRVYNGSLPILAVDDRKQQRGGEFTLLYVGRLEAVKNHSLLLHAFKSAHTRNPRLQLWMVGDGSERDRLEALCAELQIQPHVTFWGQQMDVTGFFAAADAFIMSSVSEGLPMSLLQAFSAGLPAIVTEVGGMAEVVHLAQAGIAVPTQDCAAMASAILRLAECGEVCEQFSRNAQAAFARHFTLDAMAAAYMQLYLNTSRIRSRMNAPDR